MVLLPGLRQGDGRGVRAGELDRLIDRASLRDQLGEGLQLRVP